MFREKCFFLCYVVLFLGFASCVPLNLPQGGNVLQDDFLRMKMSQYLNFKEKLNLPTPTAEELSTIFPGYSKLRGSAEKAQVNPKHVGFYIYTKDNPTSAVRLLINDTEGLINAGYKKGYKTKFLVHGFLGHLTSDMIQSIKDNLLSTSNEDLNVITFDWSLYTIFYVDVYEKSLSAGRIIADFMNFLVREGTALEDIHCIGHSLGAHACGFAGSQVQNGLIDRISGLDPAKPGFDVKNMTARLNINDARFVDCIHTCAGLLGITEPICTADFYPNSGSSQPGCPWYDLGACSHGRSHEFFAESILPGHVFPAATCETLDFQPDECIFKGALMGYPATERYTGIFYTQTRSETPFALNLTDIQS